MLHTLDIRTDPATAATPERLAQLCAKTLDVDRRRVMKVDIVRRSIDARQRRVMVNLGVRVHVDAVEPEQEPDSPVYGDVSRAPQAIVVGAGPAGLFAALELIELGVRPIAVSYTH